MKILIFALFVAAFLNVSAGVAEVASKVNAGLHVKKPELDLKVVNDTVHKALDEVSETLNKVPNVDPSDLDADPEANVQAGVQKRALLSDAVLKDHHGANVRATVGFKAHVEDASSSDDDDEDDDSNDD